MKRAALLMTVLAPLSGALAQNSFHVGKGSVFLAPNASVAFTHASTDSAGSSSIDNFTIGAAAGWFVTDWLAPVAGLNMMYADAGGNSLTVFGFGAGLRAAYTAKPPFIPYVQVVPGLAHYSVDVGSTFPVTAPDETGFALNAGAGFDFLMADHVSLGLAFNFNQTFTDPALRTLGVLIAMGIYL